MKIKHEQIRDALLAWSAAEKNGRFGVTTKITEKYLQLGGGTLDLAQIVDASGCVDLDARRNNTQNIFRRWINGDTAEQRQKIQQLLPAILEAMPAELQARLLVSGSIEYRAIQHVRESLNHSLTALNELSAVYVGTVIADLLGRKPEPGSSGSSITVH